ncbi:MAG: glutamate racemase [Candidatus Hydrogenedentes bacterium]|nr:glutamate racemase [Candidatus Hydrogenedentota bacterium]
MRDSSNPIGVFDSGVGGLTVMDAIMRRLPDESLIYLGDTARVPYGTKSADTVIRYARSCAGILVERGIKLLVVACNTASAYAIDALSKELDIPVLGVIEPGARRAVAATGSGRIGVIGTVGTIRSERYQKVIKALAPASHVFCKACPLFVPLAEEGWTTGSVPLLTASAYLSELLHQEIDTLVLGCTHYPLLKRTIAETVGANVALVDSAEATSEAVCEALSEQGLLQDANSTAKRTFLVTDDPDSFARTGRRFLNDAITSIEWVDVT